MHQFENNLLSNSIKCSQRYSNDNKLYAVIMETDEIPITEEGCCKVECSEEGQDNRQEDGVSTDELEIKWADGNGSVTPTSSRTGSAATTRTASSVAIPHVVYTPPKIIVKKPSSNGGERI